MTSTALMNVDAFKGKAPAAAFAGLDPNAESLADGIGSSYGIVGYKGKVWTLRLRGETYQFVRPDDGSPAAFLDCIVLRSPPYKSKSYYTAGTFNDASSAGVRPICAALDGVTPDADILTPQATACAVCPKNVFTTNAEGRKGKECSDYKRLAILILPSMTKALLGAALMEPVFLRVPAASLNDMALLGEAMAKQGYHYSTYVTRIGFDPTKPHPQMMFRALQELTDNEAPMVLPLREDATAIRITGEEDIKRPRLAAPQQVAALPAPVAVRAAALGSEVARAAEAAKAAALEAARKLIADAAAAVTANAAKAAEPEKVDTGFGDIQPAAAGEKLVVAGSGTATTPAPTQAATAAPAANTASDTGAPEEADDDLDARVASLFQTT